MTYNRIRLLLMKDRGFMGDLHFLVAVAQLVRVPGCGPGGRGFESHQPPHAGAKFVLLRFIFLPQKKWMTNEKTTETDEKYKHNI